MNFARLSDTLLHNRFAEALGWTLLHSLWQIALIAALCALALSLLHRRRPNLRYLIACAAMLFMVALPVATCFLLLPPASHAAPPPEFTVSLSPISQIQPIPLAVTVPPPPPPFQPPPALSLRARLDRAIQPWLPGAVACYFVGVFFIALRLALGYRRLRGLVCTANQNASSGINGSVRDLLENLARKMGLRGGGRMVRLLHCARVEVPTLIGAWRPVILLPATALTGLSADQLAALLAHELAHIRRHDYLVNIIQSIIETLLFYHPAVWWLSARIRQERENCCDDAAVAITGDRLAYAKALAAMESLRAAPERIPADLALAARGGRLLPRIRRLLGITPRTRARDYLSLPALITCLLILCGMIYVGCSKSGENAPKASTAATSTQQPPSAATPADSNSKDATVRVYDIHDMLTALDAPSQQRTDLVNSIMDTIKATAAPDSWKDAGGTIGSIHELNGQLVVSQTEDNQRKISTLLQQLRETRSVQIAVESRMIRVASNFLDDFRLSDDLRVGADASAQARTLASAAAPHPDEKMHATVLDNWSLNILIAATQADPRTITMTAPRATLFNGQRGFVSISNRDAKFPIAATLNLKPVVSADRRYVILTIDPLILKTGDAALPQTPPAPATLTSTGSSPAQPNTMLSIPDGGTLMFAGPVEGDPAHLLLVFVRPNIIIHREIETNAVRSANDRPTDLPVSEALATQAAAIIRQADGAILRVNQKAGQVYINLSQKDGIEEGMSFAVYDSKLLHRDSAGVTPVTLGAIEVLTVGEAISVCRITQPSPGRSIQPDDQISNLVYHYSKRKSHLALIGDFDLDGDGVATAAERDRLITMITGWGGQIDPALTPQTDFLVVGTRPLTSSVGRTEYDEAITAAKRFATPALAADRFFSMTGHPAPATPAPATTAPSTAPASAPKSAKLAPGDTINVEVFELVAPGATWSGQVTLDTDGNITLSNLPKIHAAGLTTDELADKISRAAVAPSKLPPPWSQGPEVKVTRQSPVTTAPATAPASAAPATQSRAVTTTPLESDYKDKPASVELFTITVFVSRWLREPTTDGAIGPILKHPTDDQIKNAEIQAFAMGKEIASKARAPGADWAKLAEDYRSADQAARTGGRYTDMIKKGSLADAKMESLVFSLPANTVGEPLLIHEADFTKSLVVVVKVGKKETAPAIPQPAAIVPATSPATAPASGPQILLKGLLAECNDSDLTKLFAGGVDVTTSPNGPTAGTTKAPMPATAQGLSLGFTNDTTEEQLAVLVENLTKKDALQVLSRPSVLTSNNLEAVLSIGDTVDYISGYKPKDAADPNSEAVPQTAKKFVGIRLAVKPSLRNQTDVRLELHISVSRLLPSDAGPAPQTAEIDAKKVAYENDAQKMQDEIQKMQNDVTHPVFKTDSPEFLQLQLDLLRKVNDYRAFTVGRPLNLPAPVVDEREVTSTVSVKLDRTLVFGIPGFDRDALDSAATQPATTPAKTPRKQLLLFLTPHLTAPTSPEKK